MTTLYTFGHGTISAEEFSSLLKDAGIHLVVDVRSFPGSRRNPQFGRDEMQRWVPEAGLEYLWMPKLGGRRKPLADSKHTALRNDAFRAYADYMESPDFRSGIDELLRLAQSTSLAVMCSETVWWRCHRRLVSDYLHLIHGTEVLHLMHDGKLTQHMPTEGVRLSGDQVIYDVGVTPSLGASS